jgi:hypothetical protein
LWSGLLAGLDKSPVKRFDALDNPSNPGWEFMVEFILLDNV